MLVVLELQDQPANIRRVTVRHDIVIGRGSDCNLRLSAPQISRRHCFLRIGRDSATIMDLDSRNGTFLDDVRVESGRSYNLTSGATLSLGPVRFRIDVRAESTGIADLPVLDESIPVAGAVPNRGMSTHCHDLPPQPAGGDNADSGLQYSVEHYGRSAESHEPTADLDADSQFFPHSGSSLPELGQGGAAVRGGRNSDVPPIPPAGLCAAEPISDQAQNFADAAQRLADENAGIEPDNNWFAGISPSPQQQVNDDDLRQFFRSLP